jgi:hypothetical protein
VFLELEIVPILAEYSYIVLDPLTEIIISFARDDMLRYLTIHRSRECDDICTILLEQSKVDPRSPIVVSLELRYRNEFDEILVSIIVASEEDDLIYLIILVSIGSSFFG